MSKKRVLIFLDELFYKDNGRFISNYSSARFFDEISSFEKKFLVPVANEKKEEVSQYTSTLEKNETISFPEWNSVMSFVKFYFKSSGNRKRIKEIVKSAIKDQDAVWVRLPSLPGMMVAEEAIKERKKVFIHYAGDIENAWKNNKYKGLERVFAFFLSGYMHKKSLKLSANRLSVNFCTGSALQKVFKKVNDESYFFIDSVVSKTSLVDHNYDLNLKKFIYVGRFTEDKGVLDLMRIFEEIGCDHQNIKLTLIGFGPEEQKIKECIKKSKNSSIYNFIGYVPNAEVGGYLKDHDYFILPSKARYEGFPRVIIEAWAHGLTVISTKVGGVEGLGKDQKNILFSELDDYNGLNKNISGVINNEVNAEEMHNFIVKHREEITFEYYRDVVESSVNSI